MTTPSSPPGPLRDVATVDDEAQAWFLRRQAGPLGATEQARFDAWCEADARHVAAYREVAALWSDVAPLEHAFAPSGRAEEKPARRPSRQGRRPQRRWFGLAAGGLAMAGLVLLLLAPTLSHLPTRLMADHSTAVGQQRSVGLPDGSTALLDTDSAIDVAFGNGRRVVTLLYGRAWFDVRKDAARPFDVVAAGGRTTAVGTAFAVRVDGAEATVTVTEGTVRVSSPDDAAPAAGPADGSTVTLDAGGQVSYRRGGRPARPAQVDPAIATAWRTGTILIRERSLDDALAEIRRYRPGHIVLLRESERRTPVTARLAVSDLDGGIAALAATHGLTVTNLTDWLLILR